MIGTRDDAMLDRVRQRLATGAGVDPDALEAAVRQEAGAVVDDVVFAALRAQVSAELTGAGPLEPLLALPGVTDVLVTAPDAVWIDRGVGVERTEVCFPDEAAVRRLAQRLVAASGRRLDDACPYADAALADGTRLHAVLPPLVATTTLSLRVLARRRFTLGGLISAGTVAPRAAALLQAAVEARLAMVFSGGTGSGKTTLLGALLGQVRHDERLLVIEDAAELVIAHPHVVRLVTRAANVEGVGAVGLRELVRQALRMRPDRLVVGEFRGAEMVELLVALNTGHEGGAATVHANSASDVPARFAALGALGGLSPSAVVPLVSSAIDLVVHLRRLRDGTGVVDEIGLLDQDGQMLRARTVWTRRCGDGPAGAAVEDLLRARGVVPAPENGSS
jgi:pilus assembly protein CpaF